VEFVSLVKNPAIEVNWQAFNAKSIMFQSIPDKQKLAGPLMIPDMPIYRFDNEMGEYYIVFDAESIEKMAEKFNRSSKGNNINLEHTDKTVQAFVAENWITGDSDKSKSSFGFDLPKGTWFAVVKVDDEQFWMDSVKGNVVMGFSIEGLFSMDKINKQVMNKMNIKNFKMAEAKLGDGTVLVTDTEVLAVGDDIFVLDADGNKTPAEDGDYTLEDGTVLTVAGGKVENIVAASEVAAEAFADYEVTGGGMFRAEALEVGKEAIFVQDGVEAQAHGEYFLVDGTKVVCEEGVITMVEMPAEQAMAMTPEEMQSVIDQVLAAIQPAHDEMNGRITLLEERVTALEESLTNANTANEELSHKLEEFAKRPGADSKTKKSPIEPNVKKSFEEKLEIIRNMKK
jgi:hypothetical protein